MALRLGCETLLVKPSAIGSRNTDMTIGMSCVTSSKARAADDVCPTIAFGFAATRSRARRGSD